MKKTHLMVRILPIGETTSLIFGTILDQDGDSAPSRLLEEYNLDTSSAASASHGGCSAINI